MEAVGASTMTSAREKFQGVWTQIRSMTAMEDERVNQWKEGGVSRKSLEEGKGPEVEEDTGVSFEAMVKTVFGSCTTGNFRSAAMQPGLAPTSTRSSSTKQQTFDHSPSPPRKTSGAPPRGDERARAAHVVQNLRDHQETDRSKRSPPKAMLSPVDSTALTKPFPVSSPKRGSSPLHRTPALIREVPAPPAPVQGIESTGTFDDGISAISAFTLEEMARQEELHRQTNLLPVRSDLTTDDFDEAVEHSRSTDSPALFHDKKNTVPEEGQMNNLQVARGRSSTTYNTQLSKRTRSTRSSKETKSTFESNWRRNEQEYWEEQVAEEEAEFDTSPRQRLEMVKKARDMRERSRSRSGELRKHDATITTAGTSSMHSGFDSPFSVKHPHETLHFDANDFFPSTETIHANRQVHDALVDDPDRIVTDQEVLLIAEDGEIGEI